MFLKIFVEFIEEYGKGFKLKLFLAAIFSLVMGAFEFFGLFLIFPFVLILAGNTSFLNIPALQPVLNNAFISNNIKIIALALCLGIVLIYIIKNIFMIFYTKYQNAVFADWQSVIYSKVLNNLMHLPYLKLSSMPYGDKTSLLDNALAQSTGGFVYRVILLFSNCIMAFCILGFLFYKFAIPAIVTAIFLGTFAYIELLFFKKRAKKFSAKLLESSRTIGSLTQYTLKGAKEIAISKNKKFFIKKLEEKYNAYNRTMRLLATNSAYPNYVTEIGIIISFGILAGLIFFLEKEASGFLVSSLAVVAAVVLRLVPILNKIQSSTYGINQSRNYIVWFLKTSKQIKGLAQNNKDHKIIPFNNSIRLNNVNFTYQNDSREDEESFSLNNINLEIKKGEFIGIVGLSGSGKTTLMDILSGLNMPDTGSFYVDDMEINPLNASGWQKHIAILPQDFFLIPTNIFDNITFGEDEKDVDYEKITDSLKKADLYDKIKDDLYKLPSDLSHGQKHRLALARAFYQDADVLFLDEATSSLDLETENKITESVSKLKGEKTIISIAHRLSTLKKCDTLLYMKEGKIVDKGSFKELKEKYPDFENMLKLSTFNIS